MITKIVQPRKTRDQRDHIKPTVESFKTLVKVRRVFTMKSLLLFGLLLAASVCSLVECKAILDVLTMDVASLLNTPKLSIIRGKTAKRKEHAYQIALINADGPYCGGAVSNFDLYLYETDKHIF